ncbi:MAG: hypothetical protein DCC43_08055 [Candidatus Brocadia sp.]|nr:hypothetical protein [Candidatus Brocadia sp.]MCE7912092.1 hypothetical protein [Candidatus Brocadia sp. AMX3]MDG5997222.1 hypothetical protein [Candidatus Brocadia sp.]RIJ99693.1 MAG: hypothetical protein DCC43_08055 [Candidatus Brocadia sp.]
MSTTLYLLKRSPVLLLMPFAMYLFPMVFYVIIVLSIGKILHLLSKGYYFQHKYFLHGRKQKKIRRGGIARFHGETGESRYGCTKIC